MGKSTHCFSYPSLIMVMMLWLCACSVTPKEQTVAALNKLADDESQYAVSTRSDRIGRIVVPVTINNQQSSFHLMLDTGATHSVLTSDAIHRLGLDIAGASTSIVQGVSGRAAVPVVIVDRMQAGALQLSNLRVPVIDGTVVAGLDGILGVDGMGGKVISADFVKDRIKISDSSGTISNPLYAVIKFSLVSRRLVVVDGMVGRIPVRAVIDTGGSQTLGNVALLNALIRKRNNHSDANDSGVIDIVDNLQNGRMLLAPLITLGPANITNAALVCGDFSIFHVWNLDKKPTLLVGMDVLGQLGELSIDYRRQELQIRPRDFK